MKKTYDLEELDCANCASKMERKISKLDGVKFVDVNFMAQKLTIEADDEVFESVMDNAVRLIAKVEPDCRVIRK